MVQQDFAKYSGVSLLRHCIATLVWFLLHIQAITTLQVVGALYLIAHGIIIALYN